MHALPYGFDTFNLSAPLPSCARWKEHMPKKRDPVAYGIYMKARKLWRSKLEFELTRQEATRILSDVSKAAEMGDWGAHALLAHFYLEGLGGLDSNRVLDSIPEKAIEIQRQAAKELQPWALYDLGVAYEHGYGGVPHDEKLAWAYYLRAAQLGSPDAQMALASAYKKAGRLEDEETMWRCAYAQGHAPAAYALGMRAEVSQKADEAMYLYQQGVKFGSTKCAIALWFLFKDGKWAVASDDEKVILKKLGIKPDAERTTRYRAIADVLEKNPDLRLGRLDEVLPLPPSPLPSWAGIEDAISPEPSDPPTY